MMSPMKRWPFVFLLLSLLPISAPAVGKDEHHCLWKAVSPEGGVVYLLGSVHVLPKSAYPLAAPIESAFKESATIAFEVDFEAMKTSGPAIFQAGSLPAGTKLEQVLAPDTRKVLETYLQEEGLSLSSFEMMRPWMAALSLTALELIKMGYSPEAGVDITLAQRASEEGKTIIGLETAEDQVSLFSQLSEEQSEAFLRYTIRDLRTLKKQLDAIITAWKHGDTLKLREILGQAFQDEPEVLRRFVTDRNNKWMPKIISLFGNTKPSMVVVGTLHLVGKEGILEQLRKAGYRIEQL